MEKLNINDIIAHPCVGVQEYSAIHFETKDGKPAYWDGEGFVIDDDYTDGDDIELFGQTLGDFFSEDEETWEAEVNECIADMGVKLGKHHRETSQTDEYYDIEAI